jgi:hypothetical protein
VITVVRNTLHAHAPAHCGLFFAAFFAALFRHLPNGCFSTTPVRSNQRVSLLTAGVVAVVVVGGGEQQQQVVSRARRRPCGRGRRGCTAAAAACWFCAERRPNAVPWRRPCPWPGRRRPWRAAGATRSQRNRAPRRSAAASRRRRPACPPSPWHAAARARKESRIRQLPDAAPSRASPRRPGRRPQFKTVPPSAAEHHQRQKKQKQRQRQKKQQQPEEAAAPAPATEDEAATRPLPSTSSSTSSSSSASSTPSAASCSCSISGARRRPRRPRHHGLDDLRDVLVTGPQCPPARALAPPRVTTTTTPTTAGSPAPDAFTQHEAPTGTANGQDEPSGGGGLCARARAAGRPRHVQGGDGQAGESRHRGRHRTARAHASRASHASRANEPVAAAAFVCAPVIQRGDGQAGGSRHRGRHARPAHASRASHASRANASRAGGNASRAGAARCRCLWCCGSRAVAPRAGRPGAQLNMLRRDGADAKRVDQLNRFTELLFESGVCGVGGRGPDARGRGSPQARRHY